jgi:hypothetical protein
MLYLMSSLKHLPVEGNWNLPPRAKVHCKGKAVHSNPGETRPQGGDDDNHGDDGFGAFDADGGGSAELGVQEVYRVSF